MNRRKRFGRLATAEAIHAEQQVGRFRPTIGPYEPFEGLHFTGPPVPKDLKRANQCESRGHVLGEMFYQLKGDKLLTIGVCKACNHALSFTQVVNRTGHIFEE